MNLIINEQEEKVVPGLGGFLLKKEYRMETGYKVVVNKTIKEDACVFIFQEKYWETRRSMKSGGIRIDVGLGIYRKGKEYFVGKWKVRDQYNERNDDRSRFYEKIEIVRVDKHHVKFKAINREGKADEFEVLMNS